MKLFLRSTVFILVTFLGSLAFAQDTLWIGGGTNFNSASSWSDGVPGSTATGYVFPGQNQISSTPNPSTLISTSSVAVKGLFLGESFQITNPGDTSGPGIPGTVNVSFTGGSTLTVSSLFLVSSGITANYAGNLTMLTTGTLVVGTLLPSVTTTDPSSLTVTNGLVNLDASGGTTLIVGDGVASSMIQGTGSTVTTGNSVKIGFTDGTAGTGIYQVTAGATLNIGDPTTPHSSSYATDIGFGSSSTGTLTITGNMKAASPNTIITLGNGSGASGVVTQTGSSQVNIGASTGTNLVIVGGMSTGTGGGSGSGTYNLTNSSTLNLNGAILAVGIGDSVGGVFNQSETSQLNVGSSSTLLIGGQGTYTMTGGTTIINGQLGVGVDSTSTGTGIFTQTGGTLTSNGLVLIGGGTASGVYTLGATASAAFNQGLTVGSAGTLNLQGGDFSIGSGSTLLVNNGGVVNQRGGTTSFDTTHVLNLAASGSTYNLTSGTLQATAGGLIGTGNLNMGNATLELLGATNFTDSFSGTLTGQSTIDASQATLNTVNLTGNFDGTGGLSFVGNGTTVFNFAPTTGTDSYSGKTSIREGTLNADMLDVGLSNELNIGTGGTLNLTVDSGGNILAGAVTGTGQFNLKFTTAGDTLEIASAGSPGFGGAIKLGSNGTAGNIEIFNGNYGDITEGAAGSGVIIGGDTSVATRGSVEFKGLSTYTGETFVDTGFSLLANNLGGALTNDGTVGSNATLTNVLNTPTFTVGGNMTSTGNLLVRMNGFSTDSYDVNGTADISGNVQIINPVGSGSYIIVSTPAANDLTVGALTTNAETVLYHASIAPDANNQNLILTTIQTPPSTAASTPNQQAVGEAIDPFVELPPSNFIPIISALNSFTDVKDVQSALDQLTPESLQYARNISIENATFLVQRLEGSLANIRFGYAGLDTSGLTIRTPSLGMLNNLLAYNPSFNRSAPNGVNYYPQDPGSSIPDSGQTISDSPNPIMVPHQTSARSNYVAPPQNTSYFQGPYFSEFIGGDFILADLNQNSSATNAAPTKASYTAANATAGVSFRMTNNLAAGVLMDYSHTDAKTDSYGSKTKVDTYSPGVFATFFEKGFYVDGMFSYGFNNYDNTRQIPFLGTAAQSSPDGQQYVANLNVGYDFHPDPHWTIGPTVGATYTHLDVDSFTESGAGPANLSVNSQSIDSVRSRLGGRVTYQIRSGTVLFQPNVSAMWQHEFLDTASGITSQFNGFGSAPFTIQTATTGRDSALLGAGVTASLDSFSALFLNYLADVGSSDLFAQSVELGFRGNF